MVRIDAHFLVNMPIGGWFCNGLEKLSTKYMTIDIYSVTIVLVFSFVYLIGGGVRLSHAVR